MKHMMNTLSEVIWDFLMGLVYICVIAIISIVAISVLLLFCVGFLLYSLVEAFINV